MALRLSTGLRNELLGTSATVGVNPSFDSDTVGWTAQDANLASVSGGFMNNALEVSEVGGVNPGVGYQDFPTVPDRVYQVSVYFKRGTSSTGRLMVGSTSVPDSLFDSGPLTDADWTLYRGQFRAVDTVTRVSLQSDDAVAGTTSLFDECVVDEIMDGFKEIMRDCRIAIYTGSQPATADSPATGVLLVTISLNGGVNGLSWGNAADGIIAKAVAEVWQGTAVATGVAGWFRCYSSGDVPANASTTNARFDGAVGTSGAELNMSNTSISSGAVQTISAFTYTQPAS